MAMLKIHFFTPLSDILRSFGFQRIRVSVSFIFGFSRIQTEAVEALMTETLMGLIEDVLWKNYAHRHLVSFNWIDFYYC